MLNVLKVSLRTGRFLSIYFDEKSQKVFAPLQKMDQLKHDIVTLKTAIHLKNSTSEIEAGVTASGILEQLKLERKMIEDL